MGRTRNLLLLFTLSLLIFLFPQASADGYRFVDRKKLERELENWVEKKVTFTDRLVMVFPKPFADHIFFETHNFSCAIPTSSEGTKYLDELFKKALTRYSDLQEKLNTAKTPEEKNAVVKEIYKRWKDKPIVTIFGTVKRPEFWGPVDEAAKGAGVVSERIVIVVDRVEQPRKRWYEEIE